MASTIRIRRGLAATLPTSVEDGELRYSKDTGELTMSSNNRAFSPTPGNEHLLKSPVPIEGWTVNFTTEQEFTAALAKIQNRVLLGDVVFTGDTYPTSWKVTGLTGPGSLTIDTPKTLEDVINQTNITTGAFRRGYAVTDKVYFGGVDGIWYLDTDGQIKSFYSKPGETFIGIGAAPNGQLYFGSDTGGIYTTVSGTVTPTNITTGGFYVFHFGQDDKLYFGSTTGIYFLDTDGQIKQTNITTGTFSSSIIGPDNKLYFCSDGTGIYFLDDDGQIKQTNITTGTFNNGEIGQDNKLYFGSTTGIYFLDTDGDIKQTNKTDGTFSAGAIGPDNKLYFYSSDSNSLYFLDTDGQIKDKGVTAPGLLSAISGPGNLLYFGSAGNGIWSLDASGLFTQIPITPTTTAFFPVSVSTAGGTLYFASDTNASSGIYRLDQTEVLVTGQVSVSHCADVRFKNASLEFASIESSQVTIDAGRVSPDVFTPLQIENSHVRFGTLSTPGTQNYIGFTNSTVILGDVTKVTVGSIVIKTGSILVIEANAGGSSNIIADNPAGTIFDKRSHVNRDTYNFSTYAGVPVALDLNNAHDLTHYFQPVNNKSPQDYYVLNNPGIIAGLPDTFDRLWVRREGDRLKAWGEDADKANTWEAPLDSSLDFGNGDWIRTEKAVQGRDIGVGTLAELTAELDRIRNKKIIYPGQPEVIHITGDITGGYSIVGVEGVLNIYVPRDINFGTITEISNCKQISIFGDDYDPSAGTIDPPASGKILNIKNSLVTALDNITLRESMVIDKSTCFLSRLRALDGSAVSNQIVEVLAGSIITTKGGLTTTAADNWAIKVKVHPGASAILLNGTYSGHGQTNYDNSIIDESSVLGSVYDSREYWATPNIDDTFEKVIWYDFPVVPAMGGNILATYQRYKEWTPITASKPHRRFYIADMSLITDAPNLQYFGGGGIGATYGLILGWLEFKGNLLEIFGKTFSGEFQRFIANMPDNATGIKWINDLPVASINGVKNVPGNEGNIDIRKEYDTYVDYLAERDDIQPGTEIIIKNEGVNPAPKGYLNIPDYSKLQNMGMGTFYPISLSSGTTYGVTYTVPYTGYYLCSIHFSAIASGIIILIEANGSNVWRLYVTNSDMHASFLLAANVGDELKCGIWTNTTQTINRQASTIRYIPPRLIQKDLPVIVEKNGSYSQDEVKTFDTWVDGKPIYKKTISWVTIAITADTAVNTGLDAKILFPDFKRLVRVEVSEDRTTLTQTPLFAMTWHSNGAIHLLSGTSWSAGYTLFFTCYYTKTTD